MKKIRVAVTWEMCGYVEVEAESMEEAIEEIKINGDHYSLPVEQYYVDGSFQPSTYDVEEMEAICNIKDEHEAAPASEANEQTSPSAPDLTDLQRLAVEIAAKYEKLSLKEKVEVIAQAFGCKTGEIRTSPCSGKWRGTSDISIQFDNGVSLFIGNHQTQKAKTIKVQTRYVNSTLARYNPEIIKATKKAALPMLLQREGKDNAIAAQKGLKPYTLLNVEFYDGADEKTAGHMGWYYVTLAVDGKICTHLETGLDYEIADGKVSDAPTRADYFTAAALRETDVDYVFNNVGFSSTSSLYTLPLREDARERAEQILAKREKAERMKNNFEIGQKVTFSVKELFDYLLSDAYEDEDDFVDTANGEIQKEVIDGCEYYNYFEGNHIVSMDGETCIITCVKDDSVEFQNSDGATIVYGRLSMEEATVALSDAIPNPN